MLLSWTPAGYLFHHTFQIEEIEDIFGFFFFMELDFCSGRNSQVYNMYF